MPSLFESGSRHADSVNDTWFDSVKVAASVLADAGRTLWGAERRLVRPAAVVVSSRPTATAPSAAVIVPLRRARFFIPVPSLSRSITRGAGTGSRSRYRGSGGESPLQPQ